MKFTKDNNILNGSFGDRRNNTTGAANAAQQQLVNLANLRLQLSTQVLNTIIPLVVIDENTTIDHITQLAIQYTDSLLIGLGMAKKAGGMKIAYIGVMNSLGKSDNGFTKAMHKLGSYHEVERAEFIDNCDLLFLQTQNTGLNVKELQRLKSQGAYIIHWTGDARHETPKYCFEYAPYVDITAFSNMRDVENMRHGFNSTFLQIGADPDIYYPSDCEKDIDIAWMGNSYGHFPLSVMRREMVSRLKNIFGDKFKAYGINMPDGNFMNNQKGEADIYRRAKIGINLSHFDLPRYTSDRLFRMLLSGICVVSGNYSQLKDDFNCRNGTDSHFLASDDISGIIDNINFLLYHDNCGGTMINHIAESGHQLALNNYTFDHMAQSILSLCQKS